MSNEQDLRYVRTNKMLIEAFTELLSKKKFEDITINELCEKAYVRRATFYTHFLDKYDFFSYFVRQHKDYFSENIRSIEAGREPNEFVLQMCSQLIAYLNEHIAMVQNIIDSSAFPILLSIFSEQIQKDLLEEFQRKEALLKREEISPEILADFYSGGLIQIVRRWINDKDRMPEEKLLEQIGKVLNYPIEL